jgi:hypothetical protein
MIQRLRAWWKRWRRPVEPAALFGWSRMKDFEN